MEKHRVSKVPLQSCMDPVIYQCLSAFFSHALPAGDAQRTNFHHSFWGNLRCPPWQLPALLLALLDCPSVPLPVAANEGQPGAKWVTGQET